MKYGITRQYHDRRRDRLRKARETARHLTAILTKNYHARKVVLFGSLADEKRFNDHSDIDLCAFGLDPADYFKAVGELLIEAREFQVDLIPFEDATPRMVESVSKGEILYEKGK